ncbi:Hypothetical predicted protein [Paramuricea clavata]|uniref:Uncharacterized protein n=1 Tax=Paramuricea clavata TaxID=317549 RepID=A0A6S7JEJ7_PARCT|nr:Hypothetical predicted protein [Paramuricea clavata]
MKKGEVTLIAFADFSRAFDTVDYSVAVRKLHDIGMSRAALKWIVNYLSLRKQFVQVNDKQSELAKVTFGVPQGSSLGPFLSMTCRTVYMQEGSTCFRYAYDTTMYRHSTPKHLDGCVQMMDDSLHSIETWATNNNMLLNEKKTK